MNKSYMTDIHKAIADLRDAINMGEGWPTIHRAFWAVEDLVNARLNPITNSLNTLGMSLNQPTDWPTIENNITALESAVDGGTVDTVDLAKKKLRWLREYIAGWVPARQTELTKIDEVLALLNTLPTPVLTGIEQAAEEIACCPSSSTPSGEVTPITLFPDIYKRVSAAAEGVVRHVYYRGTKDTAPDGIWHKANREWSEMQIKAVAAIIRQFVEAEVKP